MKILLKDFRLVATALAATIMLMGASPIAFAQTTPPAAATSVASSEPAIKALQEALNKQGIVVKVDGVLNDETRAAIRKYQSQHHLPVTGVADTATLDKLGVTGRQSTAPAAQAPEGQAPTTGQAPAGPLGTAQAPMQPGQMQGGMMMNCPMMQASMQEMMQMMQGMMQRMQMMQGQMQPGQMPPAAR